MTYLYNSVLETHRSCIRVILLIQKDMLSPFLRFSLLVNQVRIFLCIDLDLIFTICLPVCGKDNDRFRLNFRSDFLADCLQFAKNRMIEIVHDIRLASTI